MKKNLFIILFLYSIKCSAQPTSIGSVENVMIGKPPYPSIVLVDGATIPPNQYQSVKPKCMIHEYINCNENKFVNNYFKCDSGIVKNDIFIIFDKTKIKETNKKTFFNQISESRNNLYKINDDALTNDNLFLNKYRNDNFLFIKKIRNFSLNNIVTGNTDTFTLFIIRTVPNE